MDSSATIGIKRSVSTLFLGKNATENLTSASTPEGLCQSKIQKYQKDIDKAENEIKNKDTIISDLRKQINELKKFTSIQRAVGMRNMNLNLQQKLTPTIEHKNKLKDEYDRLQKKLKESKERENELMKSIEQVKLKGRRVRVEFYSRVNELENEIEKWKIPLVRMNLKDKLYKNNSLATASVMRKQMIQTSHAIETSHEQNTQSGSLGIRRLQTQIEHFGNDIKSLEKKIHHWDEVKDAEKMFRCLSRKIHDIIRNFTVSLDPWIRLVRKENSRELPSITFLDEDSTIFALEKITVNFKSSQHLLRSLMVLYYFLKGTLVYIYNNFNSDKRFLNQIDDHFKKFIKNSVHDTTKLSHFLFKFPNDRANSESLSSREKKLDEVERLKSLSEEQKQAVSSLRKMAAHSRKRSKNLMLAQITQMNEIKSNMKQSSAKLSETETKSKRLILTCEEHEGRIRVLEIMKERASTQGLPPKSIFWAFN